MCLIEVIISSCGKNDCFCDDLEPPDVMEFLHVNSPKSNVSFVSVNRDSCSVLSL